MTSSTKELPKPRAVPIGVSFGSYHGALFRAVREFLADVKRAEQEAHEEVGRIRERLGIPAEYQPDVHVERYSMVVQVLIATTIEATIDMYAVVRFGEDAARKTWKGNHKKGIAGKLGEMLHAATGVQLNGNAELLEIVRRIYRRRNAFVHPKSDETMFEGGNPVRTRLENVFPGHDGDDARASYADLLRFFKLLHEIDPEVGGIIHPW